MSWDLIWMRFVGKLIDGGVENPHSTTVHHSEDAMSGATRSVIYAYSSDHLLAEGFF